MPARGRIFICEACPTACGFCPGAANTAAVVGFAYWLHSPEDSDARLDALMAAACRARYGTAARVASYTEVLEDRVENVPVTNPTDRHLYFALPEPVACTSLRAPYTDSPDGLARNCVHRGNTIPLECDRDLEWDTNCEGGSWRAAMCVRDGTIDTQPPSTAPITTFPTQSPSRLPTTHPTIAPTAIPATRPPTTAAPSSSAMSSTAATPSPVTPVAATTALVTDTSPAAASTASPTAPLVTEPAGAELVTTDPGDAADSALSGDGDGVGSSMPMWMSGIIVMAFVAVLGCCVLVCLQTRSRNREKRGADTGTPAADVTFNPAFASTGAGTAPSSSGGPPRAPYSVPSPDAVVYDTNPLGSTGGGPGFSRYGLPQTIHAAKAATEPAYSVPMKRQHRNGVNPGAGVDTNDTAGEYAELPVTRSGPGGRPVLHLQMTESLYSGGMSEVRVRPRLFLPLPSLAPRYTHTHAHTHDRLSARTVFAVLDGYHRLARSIGVTLQPVLYVHLRDYYATFAPGTKTEQELRTIARKVYTTNSIRLNAPLKKKYGVSFDEFVANQNGQA